MKRVLTATAGLLVLSALPAIAADLPVKARPAPMVAAPAFSWTGCYIGANGGWIGQKTNYTTNPSGSYLTTAGGLAPPNAAGTGLLLGDFTAVVHSYDVRQSGATAGGQVGCNYQIGSFLIGAEADLNWSSVKNTVNATFAAFPSANPAFTVSPENEVITTRLDWFSTIRGRAGFTWDRFLVYGTGGLAIGHFKDDTTIAFGTAGALPVFGGATHIGTNTQTRYGYALGGGLEYAITNNWSVKGEYLYMNFGSWSYNSPLVAPVGAVGAGYLWSTQVSAREHVARVGLNYKFDWGGPVVARY
jgi:outer membrane immunogenic protein